MNTKAKGSRNERMSAFGRVLLARAWAMQRASGKICPAAAHLAEQLELDDELRSAAATTLLALLFEPGLGEHGRIFSLDTGKALEDFIEVHCPPIAPEQCPAQLGQRHVAWARRGNSNRGMELAMTTKVQVRVIERDPETGAPTVLECPGCGTRWEFVQRDRAAEAELDTDLIVLATVPKCPTCGGVPA